MYLFNWSANIIMLICSYLDKAEDTAGWSISGYFSWCSPVAMSFEKKSCSCVPKGPLLLWAEANRRTEVHVPIIEAMKPGCGLVDTTSIVSRIGSLMCSLPVLLFYRVQSIIQKGNIQIFASVCLKYVVNLLWVFNSHIDSDISSVNFKSINTRIVCPYRSN